MRPGSRTREREATSEPRKESVRGMVRIQESRQLRRKTKRKNIKLVFQWSRNEERIDLEGVRGNVERVKETSSSVALLYDPTWRVSSSRENVSHEEGKIGRWGIRHSYWVAFKTFYTKRGVPKSNGS